MRRRLSLLALLVFCPALAAASAAGRFELTPTASYNFGGTINGGSADIFDFDLEAEDSEAFGITFDIPLAPWVQLEFLASRQSTSLEFDGGLFQPGHEFADFDVSYYQVGGLFQWGSGQIQPFVVMSFGITELEPDIPQATSETRFSGSFGGGVKIFFSEHVGVRLEGRGFWTLLDDYDAYYDDDYCCYDYDCYCDSNYNDGFTQGQVSAGVILAW